MTVLSTPPLTELITQLGLLKEPPKSNVSTPRPGLRLSLSYVSRKDLEGEVRAKGKSKVPRVARAVWLSG